MPDSLTVAQPVAAVAADSMALPWSAGVCTVMDCPVALGAERGDTLRHNIDYHRGIAPVERPHLPGYDSGAMVILLGVFLLVAANFRHYSTFLKTFATNLWSVRRRGNVFDDHTVSETRLMLSLLLLVCVCEGVLAFCSVNASLDFSAAAVFPALAASVGIAVGYYIWQWTAYSLTGYAFASKTVRRQWIKGFNASQALLGLALMVPAVVSLFNPGMAGTMIGLSVLLYFMARMIFIIKGFRLFYQNLLSLIYFILYLCALEIAPLFLLLKIRALF